MKAFAYHGAIQVLDEVKILEQIERTAGTSAGATLATLLSFRLNASETIELYKTIDYAKLAGTRSSLNQEHKTKKPWLLESDLTTRLLDGVDAVGRLLHRYGWYDNVYPHQWLQETIAEYCHGDGRATFADFRKLGYLDVYIVTTNISKHRIEIFSADTTPDVSVADAVLISSSLPLFYEAVQFDGTRLGSGDYYADGGLLLNYPLHIFDDPKYSTNNRHYLHGINWQTLGFRLYTPIEFSNTQKPINSLINYLENILETVVEVQDASFEERTVDRMRTISISNCGVSTTDFNLQPDIFNPTYQELVKAGRDATREYLDNYHLPTDRLYDIKAKFAEFLEQWR